MERREMLEIGSVIDGKYKILSRIGQGGMSVVYLALNERANKSWAVKEVIKNEFRDFEPDKKEIELMKRLKHPRLPSVVDVIEGKDSLLIVMDYVEGRSMEEWLTEQGAQPEALVLEWAKQLCEVLLYLHTQSPPIIYRDMKPANVMLKPDGSVTLIDFGAAREYKPQKLKDTILLGTLGYAAPEQYEETGQSDARTDIYCLGVLLFQMLTGEAPHGLRPVREVDPRVSPGLEMILQKCTQIRKEDRYQSCAELLYALEHYWEQDSVYRKRQKTKLVTFVVPMVAAAVLSICAGVFGGMERYVRRCNYEAYLLAARNSAVKEEEIENYEKAIVLEPSREEAYLGLLQEGFLDDEMLTAKESEQLRQILIGYGEGAATNESVFRTNEAGYARFAYEAGIAYYYKFEEQENKKIAKGYFEAAANAESLDERQIERARRLYTVAGYYSGIGIMDAAGDSSVTYREYWDDLVELAAGNLVEVDNERTALVMYKELVSQAVSRTALFQSAGVERQEMLEQLENIEQHLASDFPVEDDNSRWAIEDEKVELLEFMELAKRIIDSVYGKKGGTE